MVPYTTPQKLIPMSHSKSSMEWSPENHPRLRRHCDDNIHAAVASGRFIGVLKDLFAPGHVHNMVVTFTLLPRVLWSPAGPRH